MEERLLDNQDASSDLEEFSDMRPRSVSNGTGGAADKSKASMFTTSFNLVNNMVGSGLLSIPWCVHQLGGSVQGASLLAGLGVVTWSSFALIGLVCSRVKGTRTFDELAGVAGLSQNATRVLLALYTWLSCVSYALLACDFVAGKSGLAHYDWACSRNDKCSWIIKPLRHRSGVVVVLILFVFYPFSRFKDLSSVKKVSIVSFVAMIAMLGVALYTYFSSETDNDDDFVPESTELVRGFFLAHPIFLISFTAHYNAPKLYAELENASSRRFAISSGMAVLAAYCIYAFFGIVSYETFGDRVESNVLKNYASDSLLAMFARVAMAIVVLTTYPLAFQALKGSVQPFFDDTKSSMLDYLLILATSVPAAFIHDIGVVLDYKGAVLGGVVALLIPSLAFLRAGSTGIGHGESFLEGDQLSSAKRRWGFYMAWARVLVGWALIASVGGFLVTTFRLMGKFESK